MHLPGHTLYYYDSCPYCQRVLRFMQANDLECDMRCTLEPGIRDELVAIGGKPQVPCLVIDGTPLYESLDIIAYLKAKVG